MQYEYSSPPLIGLLYFSRNAGHTLERWPLVRGKLNCIYSSSGIDFLATLQGWPLYRGTTKRGTTVLMEL